MSSSLNSRTADLARASSVPAGDESAHRHLPSRTRRSLLLALACSALLGLSSFTHASDEILGSMKRWGSGQFRRFGFLVYEATLWAGDDPQHPPLALRLDYKRALEGQAIASASVKEMRRFISDEALLQNWGEQMQGIFPNVKPGEHILGVHAGNGAHFYQNGRLLGSIDNAGFAEAFFAIWLDPRTSAPELRAALLRPGEA